jgi:hypothetical protein
MKHPSNMASRSFADLISSQESFVLPLLFLEELETAEPINEVKIQRTTAAQDVKSLSFLQN